jgi:hypothetical protein
MKWALKTNEWLPTRSPRERWKDQVKNIITKFKKGNGVYLKMSV